MTLVEFIGFAVGLIGMIFLVLKQLWQDNRQRRNPEYHDEDDSSEKRAMRDILKSLDMEADDEETEAPPPLRQKAPGQLSHHAALQPKRLPPPLPKSKHAGKTHFPGTLEEYHQKSAIETRALKTSIQDSYKNRFDDDILRREFLSDEKSAYEIFDRKRPSRASLIIRELPTLKNMVIIKEVLGPPKSMDYEQ